MEKNKDESVSIILPCVGHDMRLKSPYSKELVKINEDMSIIDYSFNHILASHIKPRVIVIIEPYKFDTVRYLYEKYNDKVNLVFIFQKTNYEGVTGAIKSAEHLFGDKNILLMPNTIIGRKDKEVPLLDKIVEVLDHHPFVFISKDETSVIRLKSGGALHVEDGKVIDYKNKPLSHVERYNALLVSFGFKKEVFAEVISVIGQGTLKRANPKNGFRKSIMYKSSTVKVTECIDINTWTKLNAYLLRQYLVRSGIDPQLLRIYQ